MTKEEIYEWFQAENSKSSIQTLVEGSLKDNKNFEHSYKIEYGRSIDYSIRCDRDWKNFMISTLSIMKQEHSENEFRQIADNLPFHDFHWKWFAKYRCLTELNYDWFYIIAENQIQAVCITYHPKESLFDKRPIFYIEYIAVAPWNRKSDFIERKFHGIGTLLIQAVCHYFHDVKKYRYGFSLSAVPQATGFYESIGMKAFPEYDHDDLFFYELDEKSAYKFLGGTE